MRYRTLVPLFLLLALLVSGLPAFAQDEIPDAEIINDEGGPVVVTGEVAYTNPFFTSGADQPLVILEDQAGFVNRDRGFLMSPESQVLGNITSDFFTSPFTYSISLPIEPAAELVDVDNDGESDTGVMVYAIAYWTNTFGPPTLEERDLYGGGWSSAYASTLVDPDASDNYEYIGGTVIIYAPEEGQGFPSGWGEDGLLFTEDDPTVIVPQGYTIVNMDTDPFTFSREREPRIDLLEGEASEVDDFSNLSYTEAFDAMIEKFRTDYAYTEFKNLDWDALSAEYRPMFEEAEADNDQAAYEWALQQFIWEIPDGHVGMDFTLSLQQRFSADVEGGIGFAMRETTDGRFLVTYVGSPAAEAGIEVGAEILELAGEPADMRVSESQPWSAPFGIPEDERLQQLRYGLRFPVGEDVDVTFVNPGEEDPTTVTITAIAERDSFNASSLNVGLTGFELPLEYEILPSGYAYVKVYSFFDSAGLTVSLWERLIDTMNASGVPGLVIDLRQNGGGSGFLADQMAAYFFDEDRVLGNTGYYDESLGEFYFDPDIRDRFYPPPEDKRYEGPVVAIIGTTCYSACEFFAYDLSLDDRSAIVGHYPTGGLGGSVEDFYMPGPISIRLTIGRAVDEDGNIHIEGQGVKPTIVVPVDEESLFSGEDVLLNAAIDYLSGAGTEMSADLGAVALGDVVEGALDVGARNRYTFTAEEDVTVDIVVGDETGEFDTVLRVYDEDGNIVQENDDADNTTYNSAIIGLDVSAGATIVIEVGTYQDSANGTYQLAITESE
jgi:C-terminal processing protease CtpA/Prc